MQEHFNASVSVKISGLLQCGPRRTLGVEPPLTSHYTRRKTRYFQQNIADSGFRCKVAVAWHRDAWQPSRMYRWNNTLHLDAPRDKVWAALIDFASMHTWNRKAGQATIETQGSMGQGTRVRMQNGSSATVLTIEEWQPPRLLRLYLSRGRTTGSSRYHLTLDPKGGTQLEHTMELDPPIWLEPLMLFAGFNVKRELQALKRFVEGKSD